MGILKPWRLFVRWLARKEIAAERARLRRWADLYGVPCGTSLSLAANLDAAARASVPLGVVYSLEQRENPKLPADTLRIIIEQPPIMPGRRVA
jgi:hypothetical protein